MFGLGFFRQKAVDVRLEDVPLFLGERFGSGVKEAESRLSGLAEEAKKASSDMRDAALSLRSAEPPDKYSGMVKNRFCDKLIESIDSLASMESKDMKVVELSENVVRAASDMNMKEFRHLAKFRDGMSGIAEKVRVMEEKNRAARNLLKNSVLAKVDAINECVAAIMDFQKSAKDAGNEIESARESISRAAEMLESEAANTSRLSAKIDSFGAEKAAISGIKASAESIRQKIGSEFAGLERPMKKFMYYGDLEKSDQNILKTLVSDPASAFLDSGHEPIRAILECMDRYKSRDVIDLDERRLNKLHDVLRHFEFLVEMKEKHGDLVRSMEKESACLGEKTAPIADELRASNSRAASIKKDIERLENVVSVKSGEKEHMENEIRKRREDLRVLLASLTESGVNLL